jgi:hypothetical protein
MSLPPEDPDEFQEWMRNLPRDELERLRSIGEVIKPACEFVDRVWGENDLSAAWSLVDPLLRECLSQHWLYYNRADVAAGGWQVDDVAEAFTADHPDHPLGNT